MMGLNMEEEAEEILMTGGKIELILRKCFWFIWAEQSPTLHTFDEWFMRAEQSPTLQTHLMNSKAGFCMDKCEPGLFGNSPDMSLMWPNFLWIFWVSL